MPLRIKPETVIEGFSNNGELLEYVRESRQEDLDSDRHNRERGLEDTVVAAGRQWPKAEYDWRTENGVPAMTFNQAPALLRHRLASRARTRIGPEVIPQSVGKKYDNIAKIREGIIRNVERNSRIRQVDALVSQQQLVSGISNYEIVVDYANADVFERDIFIRCSVNPFAYIWDRLAFEPTGRDARRVMTETYISKKDFKKQFPKAAPVDIGEDPVTTFSLAGLPTTQHTAFGDWLSNETVRVATVWLMQERRRTLAQLTNGDVRDITGQDPRDVAVPDGAGGFHTILIDPLSGEPVMRESPVKTAKGFVTNGKEILRAPVELEIDRVPVVRVPGWLVFTGERIERFGMVHDAKDALRFNNYVRSDRIERIVFRNRASFEALQGSLTPEQIERYENSHRLRGGVLEYKDKRPDQVLPPVVDQAAIIETEAAQKSILDIFDIRPGLAGQQGLTPPSGVSLARQTEISDNGGVIFDEMLIAAKEEVYGVINQLITQTYDTIRITKIVGEDEVLQDAILNDPENPESADMTIGKYAVIAKTGPSAETQRERLMSMLETMFNASPEMMALVAPELIELYNIHGTEGLVSALRERGGLGGEEREPTPEEAAQAAQMEALQQRMLEMEMRMQELAVQEKEAAIAVKMADVEQKRAVADSEVAQAEERRAAAELRVADSASKTAESEKRIGLIEAQIRKIGAEIGKIFADQRKNQNDGSKSDDR